MATESAKKEQLRGRLVSELRRYATTALFLGAFFVSLTTYRKLVLAEYHIGSFEYGLAVIKALVLAKVILIGELVHVGERWRDSPLLVTTLWKTLAFSLLVAAFVVVEHVVAALIHQRPIAAEFDFSGGKGYEVLARIQLETVAFVPFFAFRELGRVLGEGELNALFLHRRKHPPKSVPE
ncbi:MAG TPA: hypothetical protein VMK42_21690 [Anaeromyxobacteraceae bacterium]|nr:hypothetical protein [Anaeromyxobacteraceae bacterium]